MLESLQQNVDVTHLTTMRLPVKARYFFELTHPAQLPELCAFATEKKLPIQVLGGGSNLIFTQDYPGLLIHVACKGKLLAEETNETVTVEVAAGEIWDEFLQHCQENGWYGLDNLAIIPGTVGAAPIQNIGAYGQEVCQRIVAVKLYDFAMGETFVYQGEDCQFAYRDSIFKSKLAGQVLITSVTFKLDKHYKPELAYKPLQSLEQDNPSAATVREAVIDIRQSKLPDPASLANTGSFFKNPVVSNAFAQSLKEKEPELVSFAVDDNTCKLSAAWLIDQCGWKGKCLGPVGMYDKHALVLVNHGGASYQHLDALVQAIKSDVKARFDVELEQEPVLV